MHPICRMPHTAQVYFHEWVEIIIIHCMMKPLFNYILALDDYQKKNPEYKDAMHNRIQGCEEKTKP